ncbi:MAG: hypothetical protein Tsb0014_36310 [Pleurocapsa sp.]
MNNILKIGNRNIPASEIVPRLVRYRMLPQFLEEIIIDEAISSINCTIEEITTACQQFWQQKQLTEEVEQNAWCEQNLSSREELTNWIVRQLKIEKFQQATWGNKVESRFLERKKELDRVSYSLIRTKDAGLAQELYYRLEEGEQSFAELARKYSEGLEANTGGLLAPMPLTVPHPLIAQRLSGGKPGQLWFPIMIEEWFVIVRLEKIFPARLDTQMRRKLLNELFQEWLAKQVQQSLQEKVLNY